MIAAGTGNRLDLPEISLLDTGLMAWQPTDYMPGALAKPLATNAQGQPAIFLRSYTEHSRELPAPVVTDHADRELYFILGGESPHWEFGSDESRVDPARGRLMTLREGYWLDRAPFSRHGGGTPRSPVGLLVLSWTVGGSDPFIGDCEHRQRPVLTPVCAPPESAVVHRDEGIGVIDTRELPWESDPVHGSGVIKVLSRRDDGDPCVTLRWIHGPDSQLGEITASAVAPGGREFVYVLDGELAVSVAGHPEIRLGTGGFIDARDGARWRATAEYPHSPGATVLQWRIRRGARLLSDADKAGRTRTWRAS